MRPFDSVILTEALSDHLPIGTKGTIVDQYQSSSEIFIVEFFTIDGETIDVCDVRSDQILVTLPDFFANEQIALVDNLPKYQLLRGQVGIIQERIGIGLYRVEFTTQKEQVYARITLHATQMMLLHWQPSVAKDQAKSV